MHRPSDVRSPCGGDPFRQRLSGPGRRVVGAAVGHDHDFPFDVRQIPVGAAKRRSAGEVTAPSFRLSQPRSTPIFRSISTCGVRPHIHFDGARPQAAPCCFVNTEPAVLLSDIADERSPTKATSPIGRRETEDAPAPLLPPCPRRALLPRFEMSGRTGCVVLTHGNLLHHAINNRRKALSNDE